MRRVILKRFVKKILRTCALFGFNPRVAYGSIKGFPRYLHDYLCFRKKYKGNLNYMPCLSDWNDGGGSISNEYFWQDLIVSQMIFSSNPLKHVDVGSRIDGFVAHIASYRQIEVFDIRSVPIQIPGVNFRQVDFMQSANKMSECCDSLSCLHVLEHFGLGRYGDKVDPEGFKKGIENIARLIKCGGVFYLSVPIGLERVEFNAHRIFNPSDIVRICGGSGLGFKSVTIIKDGYPKVTCLNMAAVDQFSKEYYSLGVFVFVKNEENSRSN